MEPFIGQIQLFGFGWAPVGWAVCNGQLLAISQNTALFSLLGTTYGGDGRTTFGLPDLRGRVPLGLGQGPGLSTYDLGQVGGEESVTLTTAQLPSHNHGMQGSASAHREEPGEPGAGFHVRRLVLRRRRRDADGGQLLPEPGRRPAPRQQAALPHRLLLHRPRRDLPVPPVVVRFLEPSPPTRGPSRTGGRPALGRDSCGPGCPGGPSAISRATVSDNGQLYRPARNGRTLGRMTGTMLTERRHVDLLRVASARCCACRGGRMRKVSARG